MKLFDFDFYLIVPEAFFLVSYLVLFLLVFFSPLLLRLRITSSSGYNYISELRTPNLSRPAFVLSFLILIIYGMLKMYTPIEKTEFIFFDTFRLSLGVVYFQFIIILFSIFIAFILQSNNNKKLSLEFWMVYLLFVFSCVVLPSACEFIGIYLLFELQSFCSYILAALNRERALSVEAALKYFILGAFISGFLLFGISLLYLAFGTTKVFDMVLLSYGLEPTLFIVLGLILVIGAFFFKLAAFPFHMWVSDVYSGVTLSVLLVLVILPKMSIWGSIVFQIHHVLVLSSFFEYTSFTLSFFGLLGVVFGSLGAVFQQDFKKFIAYSSISNMGYIVLIFSTGLASSLYIIIYYVVVYSFLLLNLFSLVYALSFMTTDQKLYLSITSILTFFFRTHKIYGFLFSILLFSMAGVPPLMGFFPKFYVISGLWEAGNFTFAILAALASVFSATYYSVFFVRVYFSKEAIPSFIVKESSALTLFTALTLINIFYLLFHDFVSLVIWLITFFIF